MSVERLNLLSPTEIATLDRWELERRSRLLAQPTYLGDSVSLCRALGRYKIFVDTTDIGFGAHLLLDGFWEPWLTVFMARRLREGMHIADVGANHGYYTLLMADLAGPGGRVAAVEPHPKTAELLRRSIAVNGFTERVDVFEMAAGADDDQTVWMRKPAHEPKNTHVTIGPDAPANPGDEFLQARSSRLATVLRSWSRLDFAKIDVEGAEEAAVEGLLPVLERDRPDVVLEFNVHRCAHPKSLIDRLARLYGGLQYVDFDSEAYPIEPELLLDTHRLDDWLLYLTAARRPTGRTVSGTLNLG
jgi:FkbM family methyltransferase